MKSLRSLFLGILVIASVVGCGSSNSQPSNNQAQNAVVTGAAVPPGTAFPYGTVPGFFQPTPANYYSQVTWPAQFTTCPLNLSWNWQMGGCYGYNTQLVQSVPNFVCGIYAVYAGQYLYQCYWTGGLQQGQYFNGYGDGNYYQFQGSQFQFNYRIGF